MAKKKIRVDGNVASLLKPHHWERSSIRRMSNAQDTTARDDLIV
jgi:hypothetical protein